MSPSTSGCRGVRHRHAHAEDQRRAAVAHRQGEVPRIVRIVLTAYSDIEPMLRAINEGLVARYTVKPWVAEEMSQVLRWGVEAFNFGKTPSSSSAPARDQRLATVGRFAQMFVTTCARR